MAAINHDWGTPWKIWKWFVGFTTLLTNVCGRGTPHCWVIDPMCTILLSHGFPWMLNRSPQSLEDWAIESWTCPTWGTNCVLGPLGQNRAGVSSYWLFNWGVTHLPIDKWETSRPLWVYESNSAQQLPICQVWPQFASPRCCWSKSKSAFWIGLLHFLAEEHLPWFVSFTRISIIHFHELINLLSSIPHDKS